MFYFFHFLANHSSFFNLFRYITFRYGMALFSSFLIVFLFAPRFIKWMHRVQRGGQPIRDDGPPTHLLTKKGTPTMGGVLIIIASVVSTLLWANPSSPYVWPILAFVSAMTVLGGVDDYLKFSKRTPDGISARVKFLTQCAISLAATWWVFLIQPEAFHEALCLPFFKNCSFDLGWFAPLFAMFVVVGSSNAVNLTDGLDGLVVGPLMVCFAVFSVVTYVAGHLAFANYLHIPSIPHAGEVSIICGSMIGACLGFLWFNSPPAMIFMGDVGSLPLGGALGLMAVSVKHEFLLALCGGIFVLEALSVILQVSSFKSRGKRIFLMAPIHHHFEKKGWPEPTIVMRFWILSILLGFLSLATLKLR